MTAQERRVRRLHIGCRRADHAQHARIMVEDGLRTATFNDAGRLVIVRRLNLGVMPLHAGVTCWSRRIEERFQRLRTDIVPADHPSASRAEAVFFENEAAPWRQMALRMATGRPCSEWFWKKALPGWTPETPPAAAMRLAVRALTVRTPVLGLVLARQLGEIGHISKLLLALDPADYEQLLPNFSQAPPKSTESDSYNSAIASLINFVRRQSWVGAALAEWRPESRPAQLVIAAALVQTGLPVPPRHELSQIATAVSLSVISPPPFRESDSAMLDKVAPSLWNEKETAEHPQNQPQVPKQSTPPEDREPQPTSVGGLFFLIPLFEQTGLPHLLGSNASLVKCGLPWHLFHAALRLARPLENDVWHSLPAPPIAPPRGTRWRPLLRAHHRSLALTQIPLLKILRRRALATLTETHIDVFFQFGDADARIRRAGLDLNPGWVPWLGKVVTFHYD